MRPLVLLFDIDGTLISTGGAGNRAIVRAFTEVHARADATAHFKFGGMTDRASFVKGCARLANPTATRRSPR